MTTRREFLKTSASLMGSFLAPTVILRPEFDREALLRKFCVTDYYSRYDLTKPFNQGSLTYASDGWEIVRCELVNTIDDGVEARRPNAQGVYESLWKSDLRMDRFELPSIEKLLPYSDGMCPVCLDRRVKISSDVECEDWYALDFDPDDWTIGDRSCEWCYDQKTKRRKDVVKSVVEINGCFFQYARLLKVQQIPGVVAGTYVNQSYYKDNRGLLQFAGEGFQGMCMSLDYRGNDD